MPKVTQYNLVASGGAATNIPCKIPCRRVEIREDGSNAQGFTFTYPDGSAVNVAPGAQPLILGDVVAHGDNRGALLGLPTQVGRAADSYGTAISMSATPTVINVREIE